MTLLICMSLCVLTTTVLGQEYIDGEFFIRLSDDISSESEEYAIVQRLRSEFNIETMRVYHYSQATLLYVTGHAEAVRRAGRLSDVKYTEQNKKTYAAQDCSENSSPGTWGLDRIDQVEQLESSDPENPSATYIYGPDDGSGVRTYVFDTGIDIYHSGFEPERAVWGYVAQDITNPNPGDFSGHGTHVAGVVGSTTYGVAKSVTLVAVKTLNDNNSGSVNDLLDGLDWVLNHDVNREFRSVIVISLAALGRSIPVEEAMDALNADGVTCVVAAGNEDADACNYTPAFVASAITVGASDVIDYTVYFSNWGSCLNFYAPGLGVLSTEPLESSGVRSGTSSASAHVAGCSARFISSQTFPPTPAEVKSYLVTRATENALTFQPGQELGSPNRLLFCDCII